MNGEDKPRTAVVLVPVTWRNVRITFPQILLMWIVSNYIGWCTAVIVFEDQHKEHFWWEVAFTLITWLFLEMAYKQSKFEQIKKSINESI